MKPDHNLLKTGAKDTALNILKKYNHLLTEKDDEVIVLGTLMFAGIKYHVEQHGDLTQVFKKLNQYGIKDVINFYFETNNFVKYQELIKKYSLPIDTYHIKDAVEKDKSQFIDYYLSLDSKIKNDLFAQTIYQKKEAWQIYMIKNNFQPSPALIDLLKNEEDLNKALGFKSIFDLQNKMEKDLDSKKSNKTLKI